MIVKTITIIIKLLIVMIHITMAKKKLMRIITSVITK